LIQYLRRHDFISTLFLVDLGLLLCSIFLFFEASDYPKMARQFPRLVLMMIMVVTVLDMISFLRGAQKKSSPAAKKDDLQRVRPRQQLKVLYTSVLIFVFFLFMLFFGLTLGTFFFLLFSGWTLGYRKSKMLIFSSAIISAFVYVIFEVIMQSYLPAGLIFSIAGG